MTEVQTPGQIRAAIKAQLSRAPLSVDANGVSREEYDARREVQAATLAAEQPAQVETAPQQVGMKPNPAQGHGGSPAPTQHTGSPLERIGAQLRNASDALLDGGVSR